MILCILGVLIWLLFYGSYFFKMYRQKKHGILADRMGWGAKRASTLKLEKWLRVITYLTGLVQILGIALSGFYPLLISSLPVRLMGCAAALVGTGILIASMVSMKTSWRVGVDMIQDSSLVTTGIYRYSRNPAFLGFDIFYIGFALSFCSIELCVLSLAAILLLHVQILQEESYLPDLFGKEYEEYQKRTPRYFWIF